MPVNIHRNAICLGSAMVLTFFTGTCPVRSADPVTDCDALAASELDTTRPAGVAGMEFEQINGAIALPACNEAYEANKSDPRIAFQLARALEKSAAESRARAQTLFLDAAKAGHPLSMVNVAVSLERDDPKQAFDWYSKAAATGDPLGQYNLALAYQNGMGTEVNADKAIEFYTKAMDQGDQVSPHNLAVLYDEGKLVPRDMAKAIPLYEKAVERGYVDSMFNLGLVFEKGDGVPADPAWALALFEQAASLGDKDAAMVVEKLKATAQ